MCYRSDKSYKTQGRRQHRRMWINIIMMVPAMKSNV